MRLQTLIKSIIWLALLGVVYFLLRYGVYEAYLLDFKDLPHDVDKYFTLALALFSILGLLLGLYLVSYIINNWEKNPILFEKVSNIEKKDGYREMPESVKHDYEDPFYL